MPEEPVKPMEEVIRQDGRYPTDAFAFLHESLAKAVKEAHGETPSEGQHHVSGKQLCNAARDLAIERWGLLAPAVLKRWNIRATIDLGNMVYLLIEYGFMRKTDQDSLEDFRDVYDFATAFNVDDRIEMKE
jgi:uncharacterized repeat protein (TIGR04138 family)